jgi:hypothetical protein
MAISFPSNPTTNQTYTYNNKVWTFNGTRWLATGINNTQTNTPIVPITVSDTQPGTTTTGSIWVDSTTGTLSVYVGGAWVLASAGVLNVSSNTLPGSTLVDSSITAAKLAPGAAVPTQTGNSGKYLTTDGSSASWATVNALPSQSTHSGQYLTTDGTTASWTTVTTTPGANTITATMLNTTAKAREVGFSMIFGAQ